MSDNGGPIRYIRKARICAEVGINGTTLSNWVSEGKFPMSYVLNPGVQGSREIIAWREDEFEEWKRSRPARRAKPMRSTPYPRGAAAPGSRENKQRAKAKAKPPAGEPK